MLKTIQKFYKQFNVKAKLNKHQDSAAYAVHSNRTIYFSPKSIHPSQGDDYRYSVICHELCHILNVDHNKFPSLYKGKRTNKAMRQCGLRMERYTDKMAEKMLKSLFPDLKYFKAYSTVSGVRWYKKKFLDKYYPKSK